jgi:hypothetical protein
MEHLNQKTEKDGDGSPQVLGVQCDGLYASDGCINVIRGASRALEGSIHQVAGKVQIFGVTVVLL